MGAGSRRLALAIYRSTLRWARGNADVPFSLRSSDVYTLSPGLRGTAVALQDAAAIPPIARAAFEAARGATGAEAEEALDRGMEAVRLLHTGYQAAIDEMRSVRSDRADKRGVAFSVGQVFIHKKYGYRGVVYGWDRQCQRDAEWMRAMNVSDAQQPFYYCLPDETDAMRLFGGVRITKYVAQENMEALEACRISHRALDAHFTGYSAALGRYIPCRKLQYEYPDRYEAEDAAPVGDDSNLLAQPEVLPGPGRLAGYTPGDGRSSFASPT